MGAWKSTEDTKIQSDPVKMLGVQQAPKLDMRTPHDRIVNHSCVESQIHKTRAHDEIVCQASDGCEQPH